MNGQSYDTQMTSLYVQPVVTRRSTDRFFILLLPINLLLWLTIGIYYAKKDPNIDHAVRDDSSTATLGIFATWVAAAVFFIMLLIFLSSKLKEKIVVVIISFIAVVIAVIILFIFAQMCLIIDHVHYLQYMFRFELPSAFLIYWSLGLLTVSLVCLVYHIVVFMYTRKIDRALLAQVINEPTRVILGSLPTLLFSFLIVAFFTIILQFNVALNLGQLQNAFNERSLIYSYLFWLRIFTFNLAGTYMFYFTYNFGFMVMGDYFANYYSTPRHQKGIYVVYSIRRIVRYHLGTIAFMSTTILPSICCLIQDFKNNHKVGGNFSYVFTSFISKICLIMDISDYALIQTSIYGYDSWKSIKEMCDLRNTNSVLFLIANAASFKIAEISTVCTVITGCIINMIKYTYEDNVSWKDIEYNEYVWLIIQSIFATMVYIDFMCKFLVRPAMCTFSIYKMASLRESAVSGESHHLHYLI